MVQRIARGRGRGYALRARAESVGSAVSTLRLGTRGSALALAQARTAAEQLRHLSGVSAEIVEIKTTGDAVTDRPLAESGTVVALFSSPC